jgi:hypothetical protein
MDIFPVNTIGNRTKAAFRSANAAAVILRRSVA